MAAPKKSEKQSYVIDARARIGHVHLKVANIERALGFYCGVLGLEMTQRFGDSAAFLSAGGVSPSSGGEYVGKPGRLAASRGHYGAVSHGDCLPDARGTGRGFAQSCRRGNSAGWRSGPWRERVDLLARSGREWRGVVLRPAEGVVAASVGWKTGDVYAAAGFAQAAE
jgi:catechol 2,3-dioxygenase-like lactoylglutathione lyase family enzyme